MHVFEVVFLTKGLTRHCCILHCEIILKQCFTFTCSSGPDLDFESATSSHPDVMEWDDSSAPPPGTAVKKSIDDFDLKLEFVPIVNSLPILPLEDSDDLSIEDPAKGQHFSHQLQAQFIGEDTLPAGKVGAIDEIFHFNTNSRNVGVR